MRLLQNFTLKPWNTVSKHRLSRSHPWNGMGLLPSKVMRRLEEGLLLLKQQSDRLNADGVLYISNLTDPVAGVAKVFNGNVAEGINWIERAILRREQERARHFADWYRLILSEIYLQALLGKEKPPRFGLCSKTYRSF